MRTPNWRVWREFFVGRLGGNEVVPQTSRTHRSCWDVNGRRVLICTTAEGTDEVWYRVEPFSTPGMMEAFLELLCDPPVPLVDPPKTQEQEKPLGARSKPPTIERSSRLTAPSNGWRPQSPVPPDHHSG